MAGETVKFERADEGGADGRREQSSISFPYLDLDSAVEVAKAVYSRGGLGGCTFDELAAEMKQTLSGAFRLKTGTARIFDLTEREAKSTVTLTDLGRQIVQPDTERAARAEAFMCVPLYAAIFEKYKGHLLPPMKALEREMQALGVSSKQTDKARQAFERSARQAGFFDDGDDRLVRPRAELSAKKTEDVKTAPAAEPTVERSNVGTGGPGGGKDHPFIRGLLDTLPKVGDNWDAQGRADWLDAAASVFKLLYPNKTGGTIDISVKGAPKDNGG